MLIPDAYRWAAQLTEPAIFVQARSFLGVHEGPGAIDNPVILNWAKEIGSAVGMEYAHDEIPWCGLFMGICAKRAGLELPAICVRAKSWENWGVAQDVAMLGDVLVFDRAGGGHVALYAGEDADTYHTLGGNQSDAVTFTRIAKNRCTAIRRTQWQGDQPATVARIFLDANGAVSNNEA